MQGFLKAHARFPGVGYLKLEAQLGTKRGAIFRAEFARPPFLRIFVACGEHADGDPVCCLRDGHKLPRLRAHEPVSRSCWIIRFVSEPGKTDGHASTDCAAILPSRPCAEKEHFFSVFWLPGSYICAEQVDFARRFGGSDAHLGLAAISFDDLGDARDFQTAIGLCDCTFHVHSPRSEERRVG